MKKFSFPIFCAVVFGIAIYAATPTDNVPISAMPITTNVQEQAYFPLIQKYPGRSTNDNFRATISTLFHGRAGETVTNLAVTNIYVSNIFATTIYTTNLFYTNINGADPLWTNIANVLQPTAGTSVLVSNLSSAESLTALNSFFMPTSLTSNMVAGENDLSVYQVGSMLLQGSSTNPDDTVVNLNSGGTGQFLFIENGPSSGFTIFDGQPLWDASGLIVLMPGLGDWRPTQRGETMFLRKSQNQNWQEVGRFGGTTNSTSGESLWKTNAGSANISPFVAPLLFTINDKGSIGIGQTNVFYDKDIGIFHRTDLEGNRKAWINIAEANGWPTYTLGSEWWANTGTNDGVMDLSWFNGIPGVTATVTRDHVFSVGASANDFYYTTKSNAVETFKLYGESGNLYTLGSLTWGPGSTNVLFRNGTVLEYDAYHSTTINVDFDTGKQISTGVGPAGGALLTTSPIIELGNSTDVLDMVGGVIRGTASSGLGLLELGYPNEPFYIARAATNEVYGYFEVNLANYSRLAIRHTGTNGAIVFDSQSGGIAGAPRNFNFNANGTNLITLGYTGDLDPQMIFTEPGSGNFTTLGQSGGIGYMSGATLNIFAANGNGFIIGSNVIDAENSNGGLIQHIGYTSNTGSSLLAISHAGTNSVALINSVGNGDAGAARPIKVQFDSANDAVEFDANATSGETRFLLWDVTAGSLRRVSIGANDSGGAGFRVLRIPN